MLATKAAGLIPDERIQVFNVRATITFGRSNPTRVGVVHAGQGVEWESRMQRRQPADLPMSESCFGKTVGGISGVS